jgi:hypothetical protein
VHVYLDVHEGTMADTVYHPFSWRVSVLPGNRAYQRRGSSQNASDTTAL